MPSRAYTSFLPVLCQSDWGFTIARVNALSGLYLISTTKNSCVYTHINDVSMPSRAYTSFLLHLYQPERVCNAFYVSMPSRAYTSFLRYPFKNLGFMRFPEPVFAGIYQNILTTAVFRAC